MSADFWFDFFLMWMGLVIAVLTLLCITLKDKK